MDVRSYLPAENTVSSLIARAGDLAARGDPAGAREVLREASASADARLGPRHPLAAAAARELGRVTLELGDAGGALQHLERALVWAEESSGPGSLEAAAAAFRLALAAAGAGEHGRARSLHAAALKIRERRPDWGDEALESALALAGAEFAMGGFGESSALYARAVQEAQTALGELHPLALLGVRGYAASLSAMGEHGEACGLMFSELEWHREALGPDSPETVMSLVQLGRSLVARGWMVHAAFKLEEALKAAERHSGAGGDLAVGAAGALALALRRRERRDALGTVGGRLTALEKKLDPGHPAVITAMADLGLLLADFGDFEAARARLNDVTARVAASPSPPGLRGPGLALCAARAASGLGRTYAGEGDLAAAEAWHLRSLEGLSRALGPGHPETREERVRLGAVLAAARGTDSGLTLVCPPAEGPSDPPEGG